MKNLTEFSRVLKEHSPVILSGIATVGTLGTAYLTAKATFKAAKLIEPNESFKENAKRVWKLYIPPTSAAIVTVGCIIGANRMGFRKVLAAQTVLAVTQRAYSDYRDKVIDEFGKTKDTAIRDQIAEDKVKTTAPPLEVLASGPGNVLCCEAFTGRYFTSDMEKLRRAQNDLNDRLLKHDFATLDDFYYIIGLRRTSYSGEVGWQSDKLMELVFSTVLTEDGRPCLIFEYNYTKPL